MTATAVADRAALRSESHVLGMAELDWTGLSEPWLLRRLGDVHWRLIADAMGQRDALFRDEGGAPAYAAFCAVSVEIARPAAARLGDTLEIGSRLTRVSPTRLLSRHRLSTGGKAMGSVTMISAFVGHDRLGRNRALRRVQPRGRIAALPVEGDVFARAATSLARDPALGHLGLLPSRDAAVGSLGVRPAPWDFNAVGLLYFAAYPSLARRARWDLGLDAPSVRGTHRRDVVYLGNIERGDAVEIRCGAQRPIDDGVGSWTWIDRTDGSPLCVVYEARSGLGPAHCASSRL